MMDPSETHNFEDQWKKAFDDASETPPPSVWAGIEARLDHDENERIIPLWWRSPKLWYAAASVAALLLVGGLWYSDHSRSLNQGKTDIAFKVPSAATNNGDVREKADNQLKETEESIAIAESEQKPEAVTSAEKQAGGQIADVAKAKDFSKESVARNNDRNTDDQKTVQEKLTDNAIAKASVSGKTKESAKNQNQPSARVEPANESQIAVISSSDQNKSNENPVISREAELMTSGKFPAAEQIAAVQENAFQVDLLTPLAYNDLDVFMQKRYVFFKTEKSADEVLPEIKKNREYWAGVGFMPASFNPDVKINSAPSSFSNLAVARQKSVSGTSKAGNSYAFQTQGGVRVSKHWSVELGLSYLQGNSQYEGGGYVVSAYSAKAANVLEDALVGLTSKPGPQNMPSIGADNLNNGVYLDLNKNVRNNYQFIQLPVQAGFTLNPDKKLSYSVLGGMMANFFLGNDLESASGEIITTKAGDDVYKSTNWAATTGLRFNYRLSSSWKATLTGSYQRAVSSGFKANQSMESHPYLYGVSWGVRYSF